MASDADKAQAILDYLDAYRAWNRTRIDNEEANTRLVETARNALDKGALPTELKNAVRMEDRAAERMTAFD